VPSIPYPYSVEYSYLMRINDSRFGPALSGQQIKSPLPLNGSFQVNVTALSMGEKVISVTRVVLPS
jgi:hypothetical protein